MIYVLLSTETDYGCSSRFCASFDENFGPMLADEMVVLGDVPLSKIMESEGWILRSLAVNPIVIITLDSNTFVHQKKVIIDWLTKVSHKACKPFFIMSVVSDSLSTSGETY